ncbi:MAG: hypothetical protein ACYCOO_03125 [Chitinophagaceae bacterium]
MRRLAILYSTIIFFLSFFLLNSCSVTKKKASSPSTPVASLPSAIPTTSGNISQPVLPTPFPFGVPAFARVIQKDRYRVAIFAPIYLDSLVDPDDHFIGSRIPHYAIPGLDFYEGAKLALDSLKQLGFHLEVTVYDSKSTNPAISEDLATPFMDQVDLIIGSVGYHGLRLISDFSRKKQVNFVSATLPNDGGIHNNPFLILLNSTLQIHCQAFPAYIQKNFLHPHILLFKRNNPEEKTIASYLLQAFHPRNPSLPQSLQQIQWKESTPAADLARFLYRGKTNICLVTSLERTAALSLVNKLDSLSSSYPITIIGMPNWEGISEFYDGSFPGLPIFFSTPYYNAKRDPVSQYIIHLFRQSYQVRPSDMVFKGFDATFYFCQLLQEHGLYFNNYFNPSPSPLVPSYQLEPIYFPEEPKTPGYFENRHIFFIKILNGHSYPAG